MKSKGRVVYFVLPEYESEWRVSLNGVAAPTGPTYLYTFAKSIGFGNYEDGRCVDFSIHDKDEFLSEVRKDDLICITTTVANYKNSLDFIKKVKEKGAKCAIGGPWATVKARQIQKNQPMIDYIVVGEGEVALRDLLLDNADKGILHRKPIQMSDLPQIDLSGWTDEDLQKYYDNYVAMLKTGKYGPVPVDTPLYSFYQSSRGCIQIPRCGFCGCRLGDKYTVRTRPQILSDIKGIAERLSRIKPMVHIFDCSDSFMTGIHNLKGSKNDPRVTMTVYSRADEINKKSVDIAENFGVRKVSIGIETGSNLMMKRIGKGIEIKKHIKAVRLLNKCGISIYVNLLYGTPGETTDELERTVKHFYELSEVAKIYRVAGRIVIPLPNARWYFELLREVKKTNPNLAKEIHESDYFDPYELQNIWLDKMTCLTMKDIENAHKKIVNRAKEIGASISSEIPRGIV